MNVYYLSFVIQTVLSLNTPILVQTFEGRYLPTWNSLDTRPLPAWYDEAKIGIFIHWGVFSVPSFGSEWFWSNWKDGSEEIIDFMKKNYPEGFTYQDFAKDFTAEFFNATEWAEIFKNAGARYVVLTSKHHEGFTLWPSRYSFSWNAKDIGPHRDVIGELSTAVREQNLTFGLYHSLYEWYNPMYLTDKSNNFTTTEFVEKKCIPEMKELIENYKPSVLWSDGDWEAIDSYWNSTEFLAWLYNESPVKDHIVVNDRWGSGIPCKHGDFYTCTDRYNPGTLQHHKWENAMTLDKKSWGFRRNAKLSDYYTISELVRTLAETISCGGNILINVGPTKSGIISPIFIDRLKDLGTWLGINGEAVYASRPWQFQNDTISDIWYTSKTNVVYAILLEWPEDNVVSLGSALQLFSDSSPTVTLLGNGGELEWRVLNTTVQIGLPNKSLVRSQWAWVLKIETNNVSLL